MPLVDSDTFLVNRGNTNYKLYAANVTPKTSAVGASIIASGNNAERPIPGERGYVRYNVETTDMEYWDTGTNTWLPLLSSVNSKVVSEYRFLAGQITNDLPVGTGIAVNFIDITGVSYAYCIGNAAFKFSANGSTGTGAYIYTNIIDLSVSAVIATSYQGVETIRTQSGNIQLSASAFVGAFNLSPNRTYRCITTAFKNNAATVVELLDSGLAVQAQSNVFTS